MSSRALVLRAEAEHRVTQGNKLDRSSRLRPHDAMTGGKIRELRLSLAWTQARLGVVIGAHRSTVSRWECGRQRPSASRVSRLVLLAQSSQSSKQPAALAGRPLAPPCRKSMQRSTREALLTRLGNRRVIASISGGKDSAAMSLYLHELGIEHERVFLDTGWESPITYEYLRDELPKVIGPITWITGERQMEDLVRHKGMFPGRLIRFCTQELKVRPMIRYLRGLMDEGNDVINTVGIRAAEGAARAQLSEWEWSDGFDCEVWRPLLHWTEQDVIDIHHRHGLRPNPLYLLGAARVGCWPCIYARKSEIRLIAETDPARIVRLRVLEDEAGVVAQTRAEREGRQLRNSPTWFQNPTSRPGPDGKRDGSCWPIERVVQWSRTALRGKQQDRDEFLFSAQVDGCMRWGLCESGQGTDSISEAQQAERDAG